MKEYSLIIKDTTCQITTARDLLVGNHVCATAQDDGGVIEDISGKITEVLTCEVLC